MFWFSCFFQFEISWLLVWEVTFSLSIFFVCYVMKPWILFKSSFSWFPVMLLLQGKWRHCLITSRWEEIQVPYLTSIDPWGKGSCPLQGGDRSSWPLVGLHCISGSTWCVKLINDTSVWVFTAASNGKPNSMIWTIRVFVMMLVRILGLNSLRVSLAAQ